MPTIDSPPAAQRKGVIRAELLKRYPFCWDTIKKMIREGKFPAPIAFGRRLYWTEASLERFDRTGQP